MQLLLERGADVKAIDENGNTALMDLCRAGASVSEIKILLGKGANVNARNPWGGTALMEAVLRDRPDVIELLLDKGAKIDSQDRQGRTALKIATKYAKRQARRVLLAHHAH